jgi:hypothetical protein
VDWDVHPNLDDVGTARGKRAGAGTPTSRGLRGRYASWSKSRSLAGRVLNTRFECINRRARDVLYGVH